MSYSDKIQALIQKHAVISQQYSIMLQKQEKSRDDDDLRIEIRTVAQDALSVVLELKHIYEDLCSVDNEKYAESLKKTVDQMNLWIKRLEKQGSSISGVPNTKFEEIAGLEDVKQTVRNYLFALKNPAVAKTYNISTNVGMLLYGPPGTGKTLIAKAIAHELGVRFFVITPSMIFGSYIGESEKNVRDIFTELRACKDGVVLLVDECESIFARRTGDSNRAAIGVANQLLQEMNGATDNPEGDKRVILGATNRPWLMDEAYLRYKRFSMQFYIGMPELEARKKVIDLGLAKLPYDSELKDEMVKVLDDTYTCADISGIIEQCAYLAMEEFQSNTQANGGNVKNTSIVNIGIRHFNKVMESFQKSVKPEDLVPYFQFRDERRG
ncbi:MAG: ATP-binding protein [Clostridiales bacterium]|nr:ATP-binding protein [Clostridiales bacterium]